jgi:DNA primase
MFDAAANVLGIRLRRPSGFKFAVTGGREGLFIPTTIEAASSPLLICEGATDAAALVDMGFRQAMGRPSCAGGIKLLVELVRRRQPPEVVIVADGDEPGRRGAGNLASVLVAYAPAVRVIEPPQGIKDSRDWLRAGGTRNHVEQRAADAAVRRLVIARSNGRKG